MSSRLDQEREQMLQPKRMAEAKEYLISMGYEIAFEDGTRVDFLFNGDKVSFWPYSGWHSGKSIKDGRGWKKLYEQIKPK